MDDGGVVLSSANDTVAPSLDWEGVTDGRSEAVKDDGLPDGASDGATIGATDGFSEGKRDGDPFGVERNTVGAGLAAKGGAVGRGTLGEVTLFPFKMSAPVVFPEEDGTESVALKIQGTVPCWTDHWDVFC
jgi:hypothetical protein